jgi:hypothetical protein
VSGTGFYPRRRGALEHLKSGRISLFDDGVHDFVCMNAQSRVGTGSSIPPGVWFGSARKIWLLSGRSECERKIQRSLEKLERIGWIRRWRSKGKRGDYPMLISKFRVTDGAKNVFVVNAAATIDWRSPVLTQIAPAVTDVSGNCRGTVGEVSPLLQELENKILEKPRAQSAQAIPAARRS